MDRSPERELPTFDDLGGGDLPPVRRGPPPRPPVDDHPLARSPWWAIPLVLSAILGTERLLMLVVVPGWRELGTAVFGALFVATFAALLTAGGLYVGRYRR
jgi:hypothetical protein